MVYVHSGDRNPVKCRALLDTGSTANFISESIISRLGIQADAHSLPITGINATSSESKGIVHITIRSIRGDFAKNLTCLTITTITDFIPFDVFPRELIQIPSNIKLADPEFHIPRPVDLLIGSGSTLSLLSVGQINLSKENQDLFLQKTRLGWVLAGSTTLNDSPKSFLCGLTSLESQIAKFWTIEEITAIKPKSEEEIKCEAHFVKNTIRDITGRYVVRLPFRESINRLGDSRTVALKRFSALERKFHGNESMKKEYTRVMDEYISLGHMSIVKNPDDVGFYMPHHAVIKESSCTTKLRVVFDASAKSSNNTSLNDLLMTGPTIQDTLFAHLIRFRKYRYVITADIEKMYRQVLVHEDDRRFQRILWRKAGKIETFQLNTLTFGVSSSPFLAIRTIQKLADDECYIYPRAAEVLKNHLYVDDLLSGAETLMEIRKIRDDIIALLKKGGFAIRQWASNNSRAIDDLSNNALHANFVLDGDYSLKTLGISWSTRDDKICYTTQPIKITGMVTKRKILSEIAKLFDPLGLLGPVILHAKRLMQDVWRCGTHWDESVPQSLHTEWSEFVQQLDSIRQISFDRGLIAPEFRDIQLHGFCDASEVGYGACIYIRSVGKHRNIICKLACAKSRIAPLKTVTIPRLELCGALILARLYRETSDALKISPDKVVFWSDSTIVLQWLKTSPHLLKTYVANRVVEIQDLTGSYEWRHVKSGDNPADAISRGQLPHTFLRNDIWHSGPRWLVRNESEWPIENMQLTELTELRRNACLTIHLDSEILKRYSSYSKLCRIVAYCLRFRLSNKNTGPLDATEINDSEIRILRILQSTQFSNEIKNLTSTRSIHKGKIAELSPFLDEHKLIRVGGRLQRSGLTFSQKHPILLPSRNFLTDQIIREVHEKHYHAGIQSTLYILRQRFWLLDGRNQVRKIIRSCTRCHRFNASAFDYKMGNLPSVRVREAFPFAHTGIDFCGPFHIKEKKYRNRTRIKVYVCIFVCMTIKSVHLEVVSDLTSDGFLAALRRFVARRGLPEHVFSDNGTNFVGANNQLKEMYVLFNSNEHKEQVNKYAAEHRILWHFIPPIAPHFGGLWESTVKSFKHHYKRVVGDSLFTFEELNTFTIEIEGILNSRPITSLSSDPNDMLVLSPAHYLIGKPITTFPEGDVSFVPANKLSTWQHIMKVRQDFWSRWYLEYLNELQRRSKWIKDGPKIDIGTIVLIKDKNLPCTRWALGRISELHSGKDGVTRVATIKTAVGEIKRNTKCLCPLPDNITPN